MCFLPNSSKNDLVEKNFSGVLGVKQQIGYQAFEKWHFLTDSAHLNAQLIEDQYFVRNYLKLQL